MQPFFSSTRASMISWPTTNWRCSSGLRSSRGMVRQGMYCSAGLATARGARRFVGFVFGYLLDLDFVFAMGVQSRYAVLCRPSGTWFHPLELTARLKAASLQNQKRPFALPATCSEH